MNGRQKKFFTIFLYVYAVSSWAQNATMDSMTGMNHSTMPGMDHSGAPAMDHSTMPEMNQTAIPTGNGASLVRDPHAYAEGYDFGPIPRPRLADEHYFSALLVDQFEYESDNTGTAFKYDLQTWGGGDYNRAVLRAEGRRDDKKNTDTSTAILWGHAVAAFWDTQFGVRYDYREEVQRPWLAMGIQGLAPYWFDIEGTVYLADLGRTALKLSAAYELLITQRVILQPRVGAEFYGKNDQLSGIGTGLSDVNASLRLRYEIRRQFAPYVGIEWDGKFAGTADYARTAGNKVRSTLLAAGLRFWF